MDTNIIDYIKSNDYCAVELFHQTGGDFNQRIERTLPLHVAILSRKYDIMNYMLSHGALICEKEISSIQKACYKDNVNALRILLNHEKDEQDWRKAAFYAVIENSPKCLKVIFESRFRPEPNSVDQFKRTLLSWIPIYVPLNEDDMKKNYECLKILVENGENINFRNSVGKNIIDISRDRERYDLILEIYNLPGMILPDIETQPLPENFESEHLNYCVLCSSATDFGEEIYICSVCKHGMHTNCVNPWFHRNTEPTCPYCRGTCFYRITIN